MTINNQNGVRRQVGLTINNPNKEFSINPNGGFWLDTYFRIYYGYEVNGQEYWLQQPMGTFIMSDSDASSFPTQQTINLNGLDKMAKLDGQLGGTLSDVYSIPAGTLLTTAITQVLSDAGDTSTPLIDSIFAGYTIPYTITTGYGDTYFTILEKLAGLRSSNIFYDVWGNFVFQSGVEDLLDSDKPSIYDFSKDDFNYLGATAKYKITELKNAVRVIGGNINGQIFDSYIEDTNLLSKVNVSRIGKRILIVQDENINTEQYALDRANYELKRYKVLQSAVSINSIPLPHLDVNNVIELTDDTLNFEQERFLIQSISFPFNFGDQMSISCSNINELSFSNT